MAETVTSKNMSDKDMGQAVRGAYNDHDKSITTSGFVSAKIGHCTTRTEVQSSPAIDDYRYFDIVRTDTATTSSGSAIVVGLSNATERYEVGQYLISTSIPANTKILSVDSNSQITISANATATGSTSIEFANLLRRERVTYNDASRSLVDKNQRLE